MFPKLPELLESLDNGIVGVSAGPGAESMILKDSSELRMFCDAHIPAMTLSQGRRCLSSSSPLHPVFRQ